jgi:hypothetical protein
MIHLSLKKIAIFTSLCLAFSLIGYSYTSANNTIGFEAGNIIDDAVFTNSGSMSVSQIQAFLNSKVPICDNWGTNGSTSTSRRDYVLSLGETLPLTCLKEYTENGKTSAQIIYDASHEFSINPQVLLVLLQKEQALITDDWPISVQYRSATGYGCPDTAACDTQYYGFTNQVRWAARMFRAILNNSPTWYTPYKLGNNYIQYHPNTSCGGTIVNIQNRATQALYNYTPYQPNASALAAVYGTGDSCGAYGNRNFYLFFRDWFNQISSVRLSTALSISNSNPAIGESVSFSFTLKNNSSNQILIPLVGVGGRYNQSTIYDFGFNKDVLLNPGESRLFSFTRKPTNIGSYRAWVIFKYNNEWINAESDNWQPVSISFSTRQPDIKAISNLVINPSNPIVGQSVNAKATIRNYENKPITINMAGISNWINFPSFTPNDFGWKYDFTLAAHGDISGGDILSFDFDKTLNQASNNYRSWITYMIGTNWYNIGNAVNYKVDSNPRNQIKVSSSLTLNDENPAVGQIVGATYSIKNHSSSQITLSHLGVGCRYNETNIQDFGLERNITIAAGETYTKTLYRRFTDIGKFRAYVGYIYQGVWYDSIAEDGKSPTISFSTRQPDIKAISNLVINPSNPIVGQSVNAKATIRNYENKPITINMAGISNWINFPSFTPNDFGWKYDFTLAAHGDISGGDILSFDFDKTLNQASNNYRSWITYMIGTNWYNIGNAVNYKVDSNPRNQIKVSSSLTLNDENPAVGQIVGATYSIKNHSSSQITLSHLGVGCRYNETNIQDFGLERNITIAAGETYTKTLYRRFTDIGKFRAYVGYIYQGVWYDSIAEDGKSPTISFSTRQPDIKAISNLVINPSNPIVGQSVNAKATIRNYENKPITINMAGISNWINFPSFTPNDFGWKYDFTLAAHGDISGGDILSFDFDKTLNQASNNYRSWITYMIGTNWYNIGNAVNYKVE